MANEEQFPNSRARPQLRPSSSTKPWQRILFWLVLIALIAIGVWMFKHPSAPAASSAANGRGARANPNRVIPVQASPVTQGELHVYLTALGTVTATSSVVVHSRIDGQLIKLDFRDGQTVKAGQLLAEIDPRPLQVILEQAQGQMARDQALLQNARQDLTRYQGLLAQDSISAQQVDTQKSLVLQDEGVVKSDQGQVDSAKLQLSYSRIVAPTSGQLGLRAVDAGNMIHASDTNGIVTINQVVPIDVVFTLPESQLPMVLKPTHAGQKLLVEAWDREQKNLLTKGFLASIDNQIDLTTGTVKLKAEFRNTDASLFPNQFVNIHLLAEIRPNATLAPSAAVQLGSTGTFVYVVNADHTTSLRPVKLGPVDGLNVEIDSGLKPGEVVVTDGVDQLREGAKVEVSDPTVLLKVNPNARRRGRGGRGQSGPRSSGDASSASAPAGSNDTGGDRPYRRRDGTGNGDQSGARARRGAGGDSSAPQGQ